MKAEKFNICNLRERGLWQKGLVRLVHLVQTMRIDHGFTQSELSFLMGRPDNYIQNIENYTYLLGYSICDLSNLRQIFNCTIKELINSVDSLDWIEIGVIQYAGQNNVRYYHTYQKKETLFEIHMNAELHSYKKARNIIPAISRHVNKLIKKNFFDAPVDPLEIFESCRINVKLNFNPKHLIQALKPLTHKKSTPKLKTVRKNHFLQYVKITANVIEKK